MSRPVLKKDTENMAEYYKQWMTKYKWDLDEAQAESDRRLSYLRELELYLVECPYCSLIDSHDDDCELAKELADA